ncbi:MAG: hypothetical protein EZS28_020169 [Streblomastix strix]|uniref:Uncharacterized protein n=1 Tax=Streblomastix strix TaxID=222440 RepID=A0A5J4VPU0_9EUKA|nr:MAG: hypothetical protein EZS28_020169 [Streblomastix strix]
MGSCLSKPQPVIPKKQEVEEQTVSTIEHFPTLRRQKDMKVEEEKFTHSNENSNWLTIVFDPNITSGISKIEVLNIKNLEAVGIADESVMFYEGEWPWARGMGRIIFYGNKGELKHQGAAITGNQSFLDGGRVALEINMDSQPRTLTLFVNDEEQPNYIINIPSSAFLNEKGSSFKINKFNHLSKPTAKHTEFSKINEWGKVWQEEKQAWDNTDGNQASSTSIGLTKQ